MIRDDDDQAPIEKTGRPEFPEQTAQEPVRKTDLQQVTLKRKRHQSLVTSPDLILQEQIHFPRGNMAFPGREVDPRRMRSLDVNEIQTRLPLFRERFEERLELAYGVGAPPLLRLRKGPAVTNVRQTGREILGKNQVQIDC